MADLAYWFGIVNGRIWFVTYDVFTDVPGLSLKQVGFRGSSNLYPSPYLYLIEDTESLIKIATNSDRLILPRKPLIRSTFDVYLLANTLIYFKEPCGAEDVQKPFFLHIVPVDVNDLPDHRKQHGFDNLDFRFRDYSFSSNERCVARRELPDYPITRIRTGQFVGNEDGSYTHLWEGEIRFDE